jgi:hypothetical protein
MQRAMRIQRLQGRLSTWACSCASRRSECAICWHVVPGGLANWLPVQLRLWLCSAIVTLHQLRSYPLHGSRCSQMLLQARLSCIIPGVRHPSVHAAPHAHPVQPSAQLPTISHKHMNRCSNHASSLSMLPCICSTCSQHQPPSAHTPACPTNLPFPPHTQVERGTSHL